MLRVVLDDLSCLNGLEHFIEEDLFLSHFPLGMLRDAKVFLPGLGTNSAQRCFDICRIGRGHPFRPPSKHARTG